MNEETEFILQCNPSNSFIEQVMFSKANLNASVLLNHPLLFCLAPESLEAGKRFFDEIRWTGRSENVTLEIMLGEHRNTFEFSGVQLRNHVIIIAHHSPKTSNQTSQITEKLVSEELENALEVTETTEVAEPLEEQREVTVWDLMEEMSRLNNELINTKRELVKKNLELERLQQQLKKG